jgi:hypothetical protein
MKTKERPPRLFKALTLIAASIALFWVSYKLLLLFQYPNNFDSKINFGLSSPYVLTNKLNDGTYGISEEITFEELTKMAAQTKENFLFILGTPSPRIHYVTQLNGHVYHAVQSIPTKELDSILETLEIKNDKTMIGHYAVHIKHRVLYVFVSVLCFVLGMFLLAISWGAMNTNFEKKIKVPPPSQVSVM